MKDYIGRQQLGTIFGDGVVSNRRPDISIQFQYGISPADAVITNSGTGTATTSLAVANIQSGASIGSSRVQSLNSLRYQPGFDGIINFTAAFSAGDTGSYQRIGLFDDNNGMWVGRVDGVFSIGIRYNGSDTLLSGLSLPNNFNPEAINIYRMSYGWLGVAPIMVEVYVGDLGWWKIIDHTVANKGLAVSIVQPVQPITAEAGRTSGTGTVSVHTASWCAARLQTGDSSLPSDRHGSFEKRLTGVGATLTNVITLYNKSTFQGFTNRVKIHLDYLSASIDGTKAGSVHIVKNGTIGGVPAPVDYNTATSVVQADTAGTTVTGGEQELVLTMAKLDSTRAFIRDLEINALPGEHITIATETVSGTTDAYHSVRWHEEF